jgi:hypothetical protein
MVPLQKHNYLKNNHVYFVFTIWFIITGLIILASITNLFVLYLVNINSEEKLKKRMRIKLKKQQQRNKMLIGDVISVANKQDVVTFKDELPNVAFNEEISVCSCEDITTCYKSYANKLTNESYYFAYGFKPNKNKKSVIVKPHFTILRKPIKSVRHLSSHTSKSDYMLKFFDKKEISIKRLAFEAEFISFKKIMRRSSV